MSKSATPREMSLLLSQHAGRLVLATHIRPDGDGAGSALALAGALKAAGKHAVCTGLDDMPGEYDFLEGLAANIPAAAFAPQPGDAWVVLDCGAPDRLPQPLRAHAGRAEFCIDHHKDYSSFAGHALVDEKAGAAAELVMCVIEAGGWPITRGIAEALWTGIVTDTGRFSYASATPETFRRAARLLEAGARFDRINERVFNSMEPRRFRLRNRLLASFALSPGGKVAIVSLGPDDYAAEGCGSADSDNFIDCARGVGGVEITVFLRKPAEGDSVKISMRATEKFDAAQICRDEWGGGGHARAAGAELPGGLDEVRAAVFARLQEIAEAG